MSDEREAFYDKYWKDELVTDSPHQRWKIEVVTEVLDRLGRFQVDASSRRSARSGPDSNCTESTRWTEYSESDGAKRSEQPGLALRTAPQPPTKKSRQIESGPRSILDVGAGDGAVLARVAPQAERRVGADLADDALARMYARGITPAKVDLESGVLPFADGEFDVVMCLDVLEHIFAPARLLAEIRRVVSPSGRVILAVPNAFNLANRLAYALGHHIDVMDVAHRTGAMFSEHIRFFSEPVLHRMLAAGGLMPCEHHYYFPDEFTDSRFRVLRGAARLVTVSRLHERIPSLFALAFLVVCKVKEA